jgi:RNA polymerase sigma-70 factor (ECF subfamily)
MRDEDVSAWALRARAGDDEALVAFVRATQADVWRYVAHLADRAVADDLTQDTYVRALRSLRTFRGDAPARVWLLAIARRVAADHVRATQRDRDRRAADHEAADRGSLHAVTADPSTELALQDLVERLEPHRRSAFVLTQLLGLSYAEAARVCDCPVGTVRSRVARAREDLVEGYFAGAVAPRQRRSGRRAAPS